MGDNKLIRILHIEKTVKVTQEDIDDIMVAALEGGVNYWCDKVAVVGEYLGEYASEQIGRGGRLGFHTMEPFDEDDTEWYELDQEKFLRGLQNWLDERNSLDVLHGEELDCANIDAPMADSIIQYALFREEVYA